MDSEDQDHFKTIASALAGQQQGSQKEQTEENYSSDHYPAYCLRRTAILFNCYRKDEAQNPEVYCAAVAATLGLYSKSVVDYVTDPRTGIPSESKFLPNIAEIRAFCTRQAKREADLAKPKVTFPRRSYEMPPKRPPDLFVPNDVTGYDKMVERAAISPADEYRYEKNYKYYTGALKDGLWVPHVWWDDRHKKAMPVGENEISPSEN